MQPRQQVLVHTDRRACVTAALLEDLKKASGLKRLPTKVYVTRNGNRTTVSYSNLGKTAKRYDLSDRRRVLITGYTAGKHLTATIEGDRLLLDEGTPKRHHKTTKKRQPTTKKADIRNEDMNTETSTATDPTPSSLSADPAFQHRVVTGICADVRTNYQEMSLLEAAQNLNNFFPGLTVEQFLGASEDQAIPLFDKLAETMGDAPSPKKKGTRTAAPRKGAKSAKKTADLLGIIRSSGKKGTDIHRLAEVMGTDVPKARHAVKKLIGEGTVKKVGNTRATRYLLA